MRFFAYVTVCFFFKIKNPNIEAVTSCLRAWCILGVFLLSAIYSLGHECQDLVSPCDGMHMCTDYTSVYTLIGKSFGEWSQKPCKLPWTNPLYRRVRGGWSPRCCTTQDSEPSTLTTELFWLPPPPPPSHPPPLAIPGL